MKMRKRSIWAFALAATVLAIVVLRVVLSGRVDRDEITVRLVDKQTGVPVTNLFVTVQEFSRNPVLGSFEFLPYSLTESVATLKTQCVSGTFRIKRMRERGTLYRSVIYLEGSQIETYGFNYLDGELRPIVLDLHRGIIKPAYLKEWRGEYIKVPPDKGSAVMIPIVPKE
jgi:hypothetical protein